MTAVFDLPGLALSTTVTPLDPSALPAGTTALEITLARCTDATPTIWPDPTTLVAAALEVSYDNGASYLPGGALTAPGGILLDAAGNQHPMTRGRFTYSDVITHVRATLSATADIRTDLTLTAA